MELYRHLLGFIKEIVPSWRSTQQVNLALLSQALFLRRSLIITELARSYPIPATRKVASPKHSLLHRVKRIWRFLSNTLLDHEVLRNSLTVLSLSVSRSPGMLLPILVDITYFEPFAVLSASVPRGGRALPIDWQVFHRKLDGELALSQNLLIQDVLKGMLGRLAESIEAVIVADRGFAIGSLFRYLKRLKTDFAIRVDAETWVLHPRYSGPLSGLGLRPGGRRIWLEGALYGKEGSEGVNMLAVWELGQKEPWFIASTLSDPKLVESLYRKRMKIEHGYRDWKSHLRLKGTARVQSPSQLAGLIEAVIVLYWYLCLLGIRCAHSKIKPELVSWGDLGLFKLGMELVSLGEQFFAPLAKRLCLWVASKLFYLKPLPSRHNRRYLRFRVALP